MLRATRIVLRLLIVGLSIYGQGFELAHATPQLTVFVMDDAGAAQLLPDAEQTATKAFRNAGVEIVWVNCRRSTFPGCVNGVQPGDLAVRILRKPRSPQPELFGVSFLAQDGSGAYADVFLEPIQQLGQSTNVSQSATLGDVIVHELGHLLLGTNAHSVQGIMQGHWQAPQLRSISRGQLLFTPDQAVRIRNKVALSKEAKTLLALRNN
jgi:hypothetical protein